MRVLPFVVIFAACFASVARAQDEFDLTGDEDGDTFDQAPVGDVVDGGAPAIISATGSGDRAPFIKPSEDALADSVAEGREYQRLYSLMEDSIELPSGVMYRVLQGSQGVGESPKLTSLCKLHYTGNLVDGTEFDSSRARNQPAMFYPNRLIKGWGEVLGMMRAGDRWEVVIPPQLGYGPRATGTIPANSVLVFEIELLEVDPELEGYDKLKQFFQKQVPGLPFTLQIWQAVALVLYMGLRIGLKSYMGGGPSAGAGAGAGAGAAQASQARVAKETKKKK